ncbi:protein of unknown function DUF214 [Coriobacterium glomerans PW2]|uniref:ABC3 transporter permease C-terminal domain-containing protein n=1 Tax=Coriobacterium glomerans (strain ATCC 49209 / DSM 20642 / JCM 10262 / PW2) TaxID=700015 RepID=F2NAJ3_CORGP|nr:ABC transporter permease [Coriobacterium glomerans]AEB06520.1 protein of unknown function DUF214 [Coriobacterium glomerans PW2]
MGVMGSYALRSLRRARARTVVCVAGIALSCALITAILTTALSLCSMMYESTEQIEGSWEVGLSGLSDSDVDRLKADGRTADTVVMREYGVAQLPSAEQRGHMERLAVESSPSASTAQGIVVPPQIDSGRMPENSHELLMPVALRGELLAGDGRLEARSQGKIALDCPVTLPLGERVAKDSAGAKTHRLTMSDSPVYGEGSGLSESIEGPAPAEFTVVGFYLPGSAWQLNNGVMNLALTCDDGALAYRGSTVWATTTGLVSLDDFKAYAQAFSRDSQEGERGASYVPDSLEQSLHLSLLRYRGITGEEQIWVTVAAILGILSGVVIVASVSLIHTGFAISVSERTRELGLLSSLGASRRQIRCSICIEALVLAAVGVPSGLIIGLTGTWVVFQLTGEGLALFMRVSGHAPEVVISVWVLGVAALLSLVTIALSALLPAVRAGRASAIDALRSAGFVHLSRAERRRQRRASRRARRRAVRLEGSGARAGGALDRLRLHLSGVPGYLAHRNLTRASSKSHVAVASIAVSVALLVIIGSFVQDMDMLSRVAGSTAEGDVRVSLTVDPRDGATLAGTLDVVDGLDAELLKIDGVSSNGYRATTYIEGLVPSEMIASSDMKSAADGTACASFMVHFIDDASWRAYVRDLGLSEADYADATHPRAIALNRVIDSDGSSYRYSAPINHVGTVELLTEFVSRPEASSPSIEVDENGNLVATYYTRSSAEKLQVALTDATVASARVEIGALAQSAPAGMSTLMRTQQPSLVLPESALRSIGADALSALAARAPGTKGTGPVPLIEPGSSLIVDLSYLTKDSARASEKMRRTASDQLAEIGGVSLSVSDNASAARESRLMYGALQIFAGAFAIIIGLIAVANVFNTLSTSFMLRRREFAVLRSLGMGPHSFRRMIALECASYAVRGLAIGLALASAVGYALYSAISMSISGLPFGLPLFWVAFAIGLALFVLAVSVAYGLRRCRADSVVEALHEDVL